MENLEKQQPRGLSFSLWSKDQGEMLEQHMVPLKGRDKEDARVERGRSPKKVSFEYKPPLSPSDSPFPQYSCRGT